MTTDDISAESIIDHASRNNITITHGIPANSTDNRMCAAFVLCHMYVGEDVRTYDIWFAKWDKRIPFTKKQVRALEAGFEGYSWEYELYETTPSIENKMLLLGQQLRFLLKSTKN